MNLSYPDTPEGYGAFDQWDEDYCEECGKPYEDCICYSPCCTAPIIHSDICASCGEHCI
jgi:hypothetical protein